MDSDFSSAFSGTMLCVGYTFSPWEGKKFRQLVAYYVASKVKVTHAQFKAVKVRQWDSTGFGRQCSGEHLELDSTSVAKIYNHCHFSKQDNEEKCFSRG